jgi:NADPH-dependent ferric siderophore reductase
MNIIKRKTLSVIENNLHKHATVLAVRDWAGIYEVDLHIPGMRMQEWETVPKMKVNVGNFAYRDYTPAGWDTETQTCTLYIDAAHPGTGSEWVKQLRSGDVISYLGATPTQHRPVNTTCVCLGDRTTVGHFLALQQISKCPVKCMIAIQEAKAFTANVGYAMQPVMACVKDSAEALYAQVCASPLTNETVYIAGHNTMTIQLRKMLRQSKDFTGMVKTIGFWS